MFKSKTTGTTSSLLSGDRVRLAKGGGKIECLTTIHNYDRWSRYSLHSCSFGISECVTNYRHSRFSGKCAHKLIAGGIGHNLPREAPKAFADAVIDAGGYSK
jgi:hypothetical protein